MGSSRHQGETIETIATGAWELPGRAVAIELTQQKADFRFGFGFLGAAFLLQFISKAFLDDKASDSVNWGSGIALSILLPAVLMLGCFFWLKHVRQGRVSIVEKVVDEKCRPQI